MLGVVGAGTLALILTNKPRAVNDVRIDPDLGKHRGLGAVYGGPDALPIRMPDSQDKRGSYADYLGYPYALTAPSAYANDQYNTMDAPESVEQARDRQDHMAGQQGDGGGPINYGKPPARIPALFKDNNRMWDSVEQQGGILAENQRLHLFHLRPSSPTRGYRSISGSLASIGGGQSTASTARIPAIFVPSSVS
jgi:hypothetical protein